MTQISALMFFIGLMLAMSSSVQIRRIKKQTHQINAEIDKANDLKQERSNELDSLIEQKNEEIAQNEQTLQQYKLDIHEQKMTLEHIDSNIKNKQQQLEDLQKNVTNTVDNQKKLSQVAFENYCNALIQSYEEKEKEYHENLERLNQSYADAQEREIKNLELTKEENNKQLEEEKEKINQEIAAAQGVLDKIRSTRDAALKAQLREQEIKENNDNFRLKMSEVNLKDIKLLKSIQSQITNAIVIDKIIQSNYYQPIAKVRFPQIIGKATACGIYKLTDLNTGLAYIGQSVDICDRQKQHCKNALGVGNITTENKLYKAMRESGLSNFAFEVLEECDAKLLDEKEKYYIELYDTYNYGLNGNKGIG